MPPNSSTGTGCRSARGVGTLPCNPPLSHRAHHKNQNTAKQDGPEQSLHPRSPRRPALHTLGNALSPPACLGAWLASWLRTLPPASLHYGRHCPTEQHSSHSPGHTPADLRLLGTNARHSGSLTWARGAPRCTLHGGPRHNCVHCHRPYAPGKPRIASHRCLTQGPAGSTARRPGVGSVPALPGGPTCPRTAHGLCLTFLPLTLPSVVKVNYWVVYKVCQTSESRRCPQMSPGRWPGEPSWARWCLQAPCTLLPAPPRS